MPLVKLFARNNLTKVIPLQPLQQRLCQIWNTTPDTTKLLLFRCEDWTASDALQEEDVYVDIRAYGKSERTRDFVLQGMNQIQQAFAEYDLIANIRLETYDGEKYFHVPPPPPSSNTTTTPQQPSNEAKTKLVRDKGKQLSR